MSLKTCPKCQKQIEGEILICPNCGYDFNPILNNFNKFREANNLTGLWPLVWKIFAVLIGLEVVFGSIRIFYPAFGQHFDLTLLNGLSQFNYIVIDYGFPFFIVGLFVYAVFIKKSVPSNTNKLPTQLPPVKYTFLDNLIYKRMVWFFLIFAILCFILISVLIYVLATEEDAPNTNNQVACTEEAKLCPDGSAVGRTGPNCEFAPCPVKNNNYNINNNSEQCGQEVKLCMDGTEVGRTGPNCEFGDCPEPKKLLTEAQARAIAEKSCIKGGEALDAGSYNYNTKTWWFNANLNATKPGCEPYCVVNDVTKSAVIKWLCTGLIQPK